VSDKSKYARRLLVAALTYRRWARCLLKQWAMAWSVSESDLRVSVRLLVRDANCSREEV